MYHPILSDIFSLFGSKIFDGIVVNALVYSVLAQNALQLCLHEIVNTSCTEL